MIFAPLAFSGTDASQACVIDSIHSDAFGLEDMSEEELKKLEEEFHRLRSVKQDNRNLDASGFSAT